MYEIYLDEQGALFKKKALNNNDGGGQQQMSINARCVRALSRA